MKAPDFDYQSPETLEAALALLADADGMAEPLAGGQSLMPMMNFRLAAPETLVDLNGIPGLSGVAIEDSWVAIGATTRYCDLEDDKEVIEAVPLIAKVLPHIAHAAIRNRGTIGGSIALADPAAEMPAVLLALGGEVVLQSASARRTVKADDFFLGIYETVREPEELVVAVRLPKAKPHDRFGFHEIVRRHGDYAMAGCIVAADATLAGVRVAFFGVGDRPLRAERAEDALAGSDGGPAALHAAVAALSDLECDGDVSTSADTKRHLAGVALKRAFSELTA
ncbi:MAG: xanthine dehydrogenase family protein subunit M [Paracoccaceae bacterium]|nr:xanthine dehydrogenase family protein subunit M [Paracoccaceae bacterium]